MPGFDILIPEYAKNLVLNPSLETGVAGWVSKAAESWDQEATFENGMTDPLVDTNPTGFDSVSPAWDGNVQFETGDLSEYDATSDVGGSLAAGVAAAHDNTYGLVVTNTATTVARGQTNMGAGLSTQIANLWFNANDIGIGTGVVPFVAGVSAGEDFVWWVGVEKSGSQYNLTANYRVDTPATVEAGTANIDGDAWYFIEVYWEASSGAGADDGNIRYIIRDVLNNVVANISATGIDNDTFTISKLYTGRVFTATASAPTGEYYLDSIYADPTGAPYPNKLAKSSGNYGVAIPIYDNTARSGLLTDASGEAVVTIEYEIDVNNFSETVGDGVRFLVTNGGGVGGLGMSQRVILKATGWELETRAATDGAGLGGIVTSLTTTLPATGKTKIRAVFETGAGTGQISLYKNDIFIGSWGPLTNSTFTVDSVEFGAVNFNGSDWAGPIYMDNLRVAFIAQHPNPNLATLAQTNERARFGRFSGKVATDGDVQNEGVYRRIDASDIENVVSGSAYVRGEGMVRLRLFDAFKGRQSVSKPVALNDDRWQRIEVHGRADNSDDLRLYIETAETIQETDFYIDGIQVEENIVSTTYCDGDQDGCRWNGVSHASTSERPETVASGGRWEPIRDDECDPDLYVTLTSGLGMPPISINRQRMALSPGSVFDSERVEERVIQLTVWAKDSKAGKRKSSDQHPRIRQLRQTLLDLVKPDNNPNTQPFTLRYREGTKSLTIPCLYEAGLEFDGDTRDKWKNVIPLRLLALNPFWEEDTQEVHLLDTENPLPDVFIMASRVDGAWQKVAQGFQDDGANSVIVWVFAEGADGKMYFGAQTDLLDSLGNSIRGFGFLNDDYSFASEGASGVNNAVRDIKVHPNGKVYVCGQFTQDGDGNALSYVAEYDPDADTLSQMGTGLNNNAFALAIAPNGDVYVAGDFTTADGNPADAIARWDGGSWHAVGDLVTDLGLDISTAGLGLVVVDSDEIYLGGNFSGNVIGQVYNITYDGTTWTEMGDSDAAQSGQTQVMKLDVDNQIVIGYIGGIHKWNGSAYVALGTTLDGESVFNLDVDEKNSLIYANGYVWNGSVWSQVDLDWNATFRVMFVRENGDLYIGGSFIQGSSGPANFVGSGIKTITNIGTSDAFPIVSFWGSGTLRWLENQSTGQIVFLDYTVQEDEVLTLDFRTGRKTVESNYAGSVPDAIKSNSDDFFLSAGDLTGPRDNRIALFITDEVAPVAQVRYVPVHWSFDAISLQ